MAKTAKVKKREVSFHSRAARRAASPSLELDPSLRKPTTTTQRPPSPTRTSTLLVQNAGIQKKQKKSNMTRAQRLRHEKGLERAAAVLDKRQVKVVKSLGRERVVKERSKGWEDVNGEGKKKVKKTNGFAELGEDEWEDEKEKEGKKWGGDEDMDDVGAGPVKGTEKVEDVAVPESVPLPAAEDELL